MAIFMAIKLKPSHILLFNGFFVVLGNVVIFICAHKSLLWLQIGYAIFGFGMGSTFANTWLWLEEYFKVKCTFTIFWLLVYSIYVNYIYW